MSKRLFELILAVKRKCQGNEEQIQTELGLSQAEFNALIVLDGKQQMLGHDFAERMGLSPSRGSRVLNTLVTHGYASTQLSPDDRRASLISLTGGGKRMRTRLLDRMGACEKRIQDNLDKASRLRVAEALELLESVL
ncbi:MAG: MarR family winged helix-turn-helix transcriptional regulator [Planctomycetota bacterium]|jgi:DNA-binding MarR family transcriptional regulator